MKETSGKGWDRGVNRVQRFPPTVHQSVIKLLTVLHKVLVPQLHVTFRDGLWNKSHQDHQKGIIRAASLP